MTIAFYASKAYAAKHGPPGSYHEVRNHPRIASRGGTLRAVVTAIRSGLGVGPVAVSVARDEPALVCCYSPTENEILPGWIVTSPTAHKRPEARRLTAFLGDAFRAYSRSVL